MTAQPPDDSLRETIRITPVPAAAHLGRIGPFQIHRILGQGGMGIVYEAEQLEPLRRMVALKVIKLGMDTHEILARFEAERQALAVMDHPNIAKALDAGTTDTGTPYFVMELVQGVPLTEYCDANRLDTRQRLDLFIAICRGVQHAHQKGVIHRDLKPSNLLVAVQDGRAVPKIIDFGIAKAIDQRLSEGAFTTQLGVMVGTPAYMSPEQAEASGLDIDTRTDIYSLGMVLYELVAGMLPFDVRGIVPASFIAQYVMGERPFPTPSRRVSSLEGATATTLAGLRRTTGPGLRRELSGDLDWIVLKAIERDRARRYETADGLALDLERFLDNRPVTARPPSTLYSLGKFVRRHRLAVAASAGAIVALVAVAIAMGVLAERIAKERNRAELEGAKAQSISAFLKDMLRSADPWQGGARQTTVLDALKTGVAKVDRSFRRDPLVAASVKRTIGSVYLGLGRTAEADTLIRAALAERTATLGENSAETAQSLSDLGNLYLALGRYDSAGPAFERSLLIRRKLTEPEDTLVAASLAELAELARLEGNFARMDTLARQALVIQRRVYGERHLKVADAMRRVSEARTGVSDNAGAETFLRPAVEMIRDLAGSKDAALAPALTDLGISRMLQGDFTEAETMLTELVALDSVLFGPKHPQLAMDMENLGNVYYVTKRYDATLDLLRQVLAIRREMLTPNDPAIARTIANIASVTSKTPDSADAVPLYGDAMDRLRRALGPDHPDVLITTINMARMERRLGRLAPAGARLREVLARNARTGALPPFWCAMLNYSLADVLIGDRRYDQAEAPALRALTIRDSLAGPNGGPDVEKSREQVAKLYELLGKPEKAAEYRPAAQKRD